MKQKTIILIASISIFLGTATAADINLTPGQQNNITTNTSQLQNQTTNLPLTFNTQNATLYATPPEGYPPTTGQITLTYPNTTRNLSAKIIEYSNWNTQIEQTQNNVSVGDTGRLSVINLTQKGNTQTQITANATGNLTQYISYDNQFQLFPQNTIKKSISYNIPRDTEFGYYNTSITYKEKNSSFNQTVQLETRFQDNIKPEITDTDFPNPTSTKTQRFTLEVSENFGIENVEADITREVERQRENQTVLVNETVGNYQFKRDGQIYELQFNDTDVISDYYYNLTVTDKAGNKDTATGSFTVEGLDAVQFEETNFELPTVYPKDTESILDETTTKAEKTLFNIEKKTEATVTLNDFQHSNDNSSITVGLLKPDDEVAEKFELDQTDSIIVSATGEYKLVVESDRVESYEGGIQVGLVDQHVGDNPRRIQFEGLVNNPEYPPEQEWSIRGFNASLEYVDEDGDGNADKLKRVLEADSEVCKGYSSAEECPEINDWQTVVNNVKESEQQALSKAKSRLWQRNFAFLFSIIVIAGYIRNKNLSGKHVAVKPVKT